MNERVNLWIIKQICQSFVRFELRERNNTA